MTVSPLASPAAISAAQNVLGAPLAQIDQQLYQQIIIAVCSALGGGGTSVVRVTNAASFSIPTFDSQEFTYVNGGVADDDLIQTQVFKNGGSTVATLTYAYEGATNNIASITQS